MELSFLHQIYLLLIIALKSNNKARISFMQIDGEDHDLDCNTVITVKSVSDEDYEVQYQDLTIDPSPTTIKVSKSFLTSYIKEVMLYDCLKDNITISVDRVLFDGELYHVGSITTKLTREFWDEEN